MSTIINGFFENYHIEIIKRALETQNNKYLYLTFLEKKPNLSNINSEIEYISYSSALQANYDIDCNILVPLDKDLLNAMLQCETTFLKMMDRCEGRGYLSYNRRKFIYLKHLRYWNHIISTRRINLFINRNIPHEGYDYVIYCLCKYYQIDTISCFQSPVEDAFFMVEDWKSWGEIRNEYSKLQEESSSSIATKKLSERFKAHYDNQKEKNVDSTPFYMKKNLHSQLSTGKLSLHKIFDISRLFNNSKSNIKYLIKETFFDKKRKLFELYDQHCQIPDLTSKYIYVALHYQPECTTSPMAQIFVEQILIVQMLASVLPKKWKIYIKEHPKQTTLGRERFFYEELIGIKNVYLISRDFNSFKLLENATAVATATGTVGWEALFRDKPVLMFGHNFYQHAPGVFHVQNRSACESAIEEIDQHNIQSLSLDLIIFLKAMENTTVKGYIDSAYKAISNITEAENISNIARALSDKIESLKGKYSLT